MVHLPGCASTTTDGPIANFSLPRAAVVAVGTDTAGPTPQISVPAFEGDRNAVAWALHGLGEVARHRGDYDRAADLLEQGIRICRELESKPGIAYLRLASAHVARYQGDLPEARRRYEEALRLLHELGNRRRLGICLMGLAALDAREGNLPRALVLIGAADPISEAGEIRLAPIDQAEYDRAVVEIRSLVAECEIERLRQAGREMELGSVVDLALSHDHDPPG